VFILIVGYTTGVFDLFHVGHLNIIKSAKGMCDRLIVGVSTDELVSQYKDKQTVIPFDERCEILRNIQGVDCVVPQENMDKFEAWEKYKFDVLVVGDDWHGSQKWKDIEAKLCAVGVRVFYLPYTKGTSSSKINQILDDNRRPS